MAAAVGSDIDSFIREQKAKLATERHALNQDVNDSRSAVDVGRRHWDKSGGRDATLAVQETRPQTQEGGLPLTNTGSAQKQQALAAQRRQEYNQFLGEKESREGGRRQRRPVTPADAVGLTVGDYQRNRKALDEQRHKEYQEYLQQKQGRQPVDGHGGGGGGSHQHDYKQTSMQLAQQRRQEYNDMLAAKEREPKGAVVEDEITNPSIIPFNRVEEDRIKKRLMEEERQREYQQMKAKLDERHNRGRREASDTGHEGLPVGQYERSRLKEREQQEYREKLEQQVAEKRRLQLQQYDAPTSETAPWKPELDKDFSKPRREATFVKDAQPENNPRDVPRLGLASTSPRQLSQKKPWRRAEHLSPGRGAKKLNLEALVARAEKRLEWKEYDELWEKIHNKPSPRVHSPTPAPAPRATDTRSYDSQYPGSKPKGAGVDLEATVRRAEKKIEELDYRDLWKEMHGTSQSQNPGNRSWREPSQEKLLPLGKNEGKRKELEAERNREYNEYLKQNTDRRSLVHQTDEYKASNFPGMNESDNAKLQKERERNNEYNQFLQEKNKGRRARFPEDKDTDSEYFATLPGLRDSHSAKRRQEQQRNREYNQYLASKMLPARDGDGRPPPAPRKGWATPTYEEMLDKKRHQEAQYRRTNDPNYGQALESDRKLSELDKELEAKKARFRNERLSQGVLDDPSWLSPRRGQNDVKYEELQRRREAPQGDQAYYATLPIGAAGPTLRTRPGPHVSESAKRRQKEQYRVDLEQQIREAADGRRREKQAEMNIPYSAMNGVGPGEKKMDLSVNYTGYKDPEERVAPVIPVSYRGRQPVVQPYHSKILDGLEKVDQISPRSEVVLGRRRLEDFDRLGGTGGILGAPISLSRAPTRGGGVGLLDNGFESLLEPPRISTLAPPPGLEYQPASYITQGAGGLGQSSVDEAYNFYATRNPLEDVGPAHGGDGGGGGGGVRGRPSQANQELSFAVGGGGGGGRSRVRFDDQGSRQAGQMDFPTDDDKKRQTQQKAQLYQEELSKQIEEKRRKKMLEKEEKERYERKLEREAQEYNPFGRGGGGAPMRDAHGNLITDLRLMHKDNDNPDSPRKAPQSYRSPRGPAASTVRDDLIGPPPVQTTAEGEQSHARGGHGIFGMPKTDAEKVAADRYKDDLRRQIEERKMEGMRRKEQERLEEEREQRRVEEQQRHMQAEYEEERRKIKEKEEEARRKNDELVRLAEERKREAEERRRAADERHREEERKEKEAEFNARLATEDRGKSPAVPALRNKEDKDREARGGSPPVPAARTRAADEPLPSTSKEEPVPVSRAQSADVLNQLAAMRQQLQNERQRVENMLQTEKNEPDVFDPRLVQRPPPAPVVKPEIDVFETALNRNAVAVRRTPADRANSQAMDDFTSLKHKGNTDSRKEFLRLFPDQPSSSDTLEAQQAALLRQQERNLQALRQQREYDSGYPKASVPSPSPLTQSRTPQQLHSDSAFVDVDSVNYFPDDFDDIPSNRRNESARARRRNRRDSSPRVTSQGYNDPFGSSTSLNVDRLAKKNEDRLRRLRELQGDDMSLYDPDDVLDRFMSKQAHNRPPSGQTLQDDTWMFAGAGSKASGY